MGQGQRELLLREQLRAIQKELGEDGEDSDLGDLEKQIAEAGLPEEARKVADKAPRASWA